ncbi:MAG: DNA polymerase III subunit delta [Candidatus Gastranaerophilales bacterium]|nr:DNA polymerase III subunit delta [Candidatus Gastranaerophilales bacterium]
MPAYIYWGEEEYNLENAVKELRDKVVDPQFAMLSHKILNEPGEKQILEAARTVPMMLGNLLIEVRTTSLFFRGKRSLPSDDPIMKQLAEAIEKLDKRIHLLFVCPVERESGKKIDSVMKLVKTIQKCGEIIEFPAFKYYEEDKVVQWLTKQAEKRNLKLETKAALSLVRDMGADLRKLDMELEKIAVAIHPRSAIKLDDVKDVVSTNENVFLFAEYWLNNDAGKALSELHRLFEKNDPVKIAATLQTVTRRWLKIKTEAKTKNSFEISKVVNMHKFVVEKELEKLRKIPEERLFSLRESLKNTEYKIKSGELPPQMALELMVMEN